MYRSTRRTLHGQPRPRRDLIQRHLYLVPNSLVVSRGCPHACDFCYKTSFFAGGSSFYTQQVDDALREIADLPGRHLYFLDDNLFGDPRFARELFAGMAGMGRVWQAGGTVQAIFAPGLMAEAARAGLRSLFVGFETLSEAGLRSQNKHHNVHRDYGLAVRKLRDLGVMVNASFVFGMDGDDDTVFDRTVEWAVAHGIETATFHILTPYPGTALHRRLVAEGRITSEDWSRYDTRHVVYEPRGMSAEALEQGYWQAYRDFYRWSNIWQGALAKETWAGRARHLALAGGWKKMEPVWDVIIRTGQLQRMRPWLEGLLAVGKKARAVSGPVAPVRVTPVNAGGDPRRNGGGPEPT